MASAGAAGINFHGGGYGWYSPIVGTRDAGFAARPLYYGMLMFAEAGAGDLLACDIDSPAQAPFFNAYALKSTGGQFKLVLINKHQDLDVSVTAVGVPSGAARVLRLTSPRLDDTQDTTTFGGAPVDAAGAWAPLHGLDQIAAVGSLAVIVPRASAALVAWE
jgi:hypothetical protein